MGDTMGDALDDTASDAIGDTMGDALDDTASDAIDDTMIDVTADTMSQKAMDLFQACDLEGKGFILKTDLLRLNSDYVVTSEQLDLVFNSLDLEGRGYLTLETFTQGFTRLSSCVLHNSDQEQPLAGYTLLEDEDDNGQDKTTDLDEEMLLQEMMFQETIKQFEATSLLEHEEMLRSTWLKLHKHEPEEARAFEEFLAKLASHMKQSQVDFRSMEAAMSNKKNEHEKEVRRLYEEMEQQIKLEKDKVIQEEKVKESQRRADLEEQLKEKEAQIQDILARQYELEQTMTKQNRMESAAKQENERLQKERDRLQVLLNQSQESLEGSRSYINVIQQQQQIHSQDKQEKARAVMVLTDGVALERESLLKQLRILKDINRKLKDDKDEAETLQSRSHSTRETNRSNSLPAQEQGKSFVSRIHYYPSASFRFKGKQVQRSMSQLT